MESSGLKHATAALLSVIATTLNGVDYLCSHNLEIPIRIMQIVKSQADDCTDGSVTQRFCIAILQKMSHKVEVAQTILKNDFLVWIIALHERSLAPTA